MTGHDAREELARRLHEAMERLDPSLESEWGAIDEFEREYCRACVAAILARPDIVRAALGPAEPRSHQPE